MYSNVNEEIESFLAKYPSAWKIYQMLLQTGDIYVMGGLLREFRDNHQITELRDADFAVNIKNKEIWSNLLSQISHKRNRFGGYKFSCSGLIIDIWDVRETWAFSKGIIKVNDNDYFTYLPNSVFLNIDALVYDLQNNRWNDDIYQKAVKSGELGIILKENPFEKLNVLRAMILRKRYSMRYSAELANVILKYARQSCFLQEIMEIQQDRYGYSVLSKDCIIQEIKMCENFITP